MQLQDTHMLLTGGMEKILRVYDMNRPDAAPRELDKAPASVRTVAWLHSDQSILSSCTDMGGVRFVSKISSNLKLVWKTPAASILYLPPLINY
jgi:WD40 repeat protein